MKTKVTIIDYGVGNILSVIRAFEHCDCEIVLTSSPEDSLKADYLVLPGVGAFADGMKALHELNLVDAVREFAKKGKPFLGICLGMQMMLEESEEFGVTQGLGLIPGRVEAIPNTTGAGVPHKIPHIGWNELRKPDGGASWQGTILDGVSDQAAAYFVHSFTANPKDPRHRVADCDYNGRRISAVIGKDLCYGTQFHPEKSGPVGLQIIRNFLRLSR